MIFTSPQEREDVVRACRRLREIAEDLPTGSNYLHGKNINDVPPDELRRDVANIRNMIAVLVAALENQP